MPDRAAVRTTAARRGGISGIEIVEPLPQLAVRRSAPDGEQTIYVDGLSIETAFEIPWDDIVGTIGDILKKMGEKSPGCLIIKTTNPDGSTIETKWCPPPPQL